MKNLYSVKSILFTEKPKEYFNLHCPSCGGKELKVITLAGKEGENFVRIICNNCGENLFFQTSFSSSSKEESKNYSKNNHLIDFSCLQKNGMNGLPGN